MNFTVRSPSIGILGTWVGAGGGDTSKAIHRILIDATLKAFRGKIPGKLEKSDFSALSIFRGEEGKNWILPASQSRKTRGWEEIFCPFLAFFARIWLWKLDSGQALFETAEIFCQAKFCIPTDGRRGIKPNPLCGIFALLPHAINSSINITYQIAKHYLGHQNSSLQP